MFRNIYIYTIHMYIYIYVYIYMFNSLLNSLLHSLQLPGVRSGLSKVRTKVVKFCLRLATANNGIPWHTVFFILRRLEKSHDLVPVRIPNRNLRVRTSLLKLASNDVKAGCGAESGHWYLKGGSEVRADAKRPELRGFSQQIRIHFPRSGAFFHIL